MEKSLLERMIDAKHDHDIVFIEVFNNGTTRNEPQYSAKRLNEVDNSNSFNLIEGVLCDATESYARHCDFDTINMNLELGLIYKVDDIENNKIKENAEPVNGVVRFYTGSVKSYLDDKQTNFMDYLDYGMNRQGYIKFDKLMNSINKSGLSYNGPKSFDELKTRIVNGEKFDITMSASLKTKEEKEQTKKEEKLVEKKIKRKSLFRK